MCPTPHCGAENSHGCYQETGRAGCDGEPADAWMCFGLGDLVLLRQMIEQSESGDERKRLEHRKLDALVGYCETMSPAERSVLVAPRRAVVQPAGLPPSPQPLSRRERGFLSRLAAHR